MHDVLAHRVTLLSLHAGALEFRPDAPPEEIAEAAGVIRASAHAALQELREVIGVLREGEEGTERPQPTLADIPGAGRGVARRRDAGRVPDRRRTLACPPRSGAPPTGSSRRGSRTRASTRPPRRSTVTIAARRTGPRLLVEVVSRRAVGAAAAGPPPPGAGTGLIGLAERVALAGGESRHGRDRAATSSCARRSP